MNSLTGFPRPLPMMPQGDSQSPSFRNPPVIEVSAGVQFPRLRNFQTIHFGQFWEHVRGEFPQTTDAPPADEINSGPPKLEVFFLPPLRRVFYISKDSTYLIQLQDSRVNFNWRKVRVEDEYPRFKNIFPRFSVSYSKFERFARENSLGEIVPNRYELTYVNHIDTTGSDFAGAVETHVKLFNWSQVRAKYLQRPQTASASWQFAMRNNAGTMDANLTRVKSADGQKDLLVLVMACVGAPNPKYSLQEWFQAAHDSIVFGFADLVTPEAQVKWEREQ